MIRGVGLRGFINGWPGIIMITLSLLAVIICVCCWCTSIFYGRAKRRRELAELKLLEENAQLNPATAMLDIGGVPAIPPPLPPTAIIDPTTIFISNNISASPLPPPPIIDPLLPPAPSTSNECPYPIDPDMDGMPRPI